MASCTFLGQNLYNYPSYKEKIKGIIIYLIENRDVTKFYCGNCNLFDFLCIEIVKELQKTYEPIELITLKPHRKVAEELVDMSDYIISGVYREYGAVLRSYDYARGSKKPMISIFNNKNYY